MRRWHRLLALIFLLPLAIIAISGVALYFRNASAGLDLTATLDPQRLGQAIERVTDQGGEVSTVWTAGRGTGKFDAYVTINRRERMLTFDGEGRLLRDVDAGGWSGAALFDRLAALHREFLIGNWGRWLTSASGLALLGLIIIGIAIAWPSRGALRRSLIPRLKAPSASLGLLSWHRALGLWAAALGIAVALSGLALLHEDVLESVLGVSTPSPPEAAAAPAEVIAPGEALAIALTRYPGAQLSMLAMPDTDAPWYRVRLVAVGEIRKVYGATSLYIAAADGRILTEYDARRSSYWASVTQSLYAAHSGQILGPIGEALVALSGLWLLAMIILGLAYFVLRSQAQANRAKSR